MPVTPAASSTRPVETADVAALCHRLGARLRVARLRRGLAMPRAAQMVGVALSTYKRLEAGDPGLAAGTLLAALDLLGFGTQVAELADPDLDETGKAWCKEGSVKMRGRRPHLPPDLSAVVPSACAAWPSRNSLPLPSRLIGSR